MSATPQQQADGVAAFVAVTRPAPSPVKMSCMAGATSFQSAPWLSPSNVTVPIITITTATVPGTGSSRGSPPSGGRSPTTRSRVSNTLMRDSRLK